MRAKTSEGRDHGRVFTHARGAERAETGRGRTTGPRERDAHPEPIPAGHFPAKSGRDLQQYQSQAKQLFRKLNEQSPTRCTLEAGAMAFHYIIEKGVCYLVLCEAAFPKKLAFAYLEDLHSEFDEQHGKKVPTVSRPYSFIEFDTYIQKTKKLYIDSRARRNLGSINTELQDVQRIMVANIEEVLQRGEALSALDSKANNLSSLSKKYRQDAKYLNMRSTYAKLAAVAVFFIMLIVYVRFWWL
ncbi:vesicle-trafficking protein SEC22b [Manacus vitellinus]|uniref:vesicle-trafficking protein SEC22b n=1 Tax=Manacus vitellinus TaxID=328815 RepID=UPI00115DE89A|nr:vesicle-trafficking protein SEC22b [Manacus vitellinus]